MNSIVNYIQSNESVDPITTPIISTGGDSNDNAKIYIGLIILALVVFIYVYIHITEDRSQPSTSWMQVNKNVGNVGNSVDALTSSGWEVYVSPTCPWCIKQQAILKQYFPTFKNIYTDKPAEAVPMWFNTKTNQKVMGMQPYENLLKMIKQ